MNREKLIQIIKNEKECVERQDTPFCNRDSCGCQCCDLILEAEDVTKAYDEILKMLEEKP